MWKHEILANIRNFDIDDSEYKQLLDMSYRLVVESHQFYIDDFFGLKQKFANALENKVIELNKFPMPYKTTLLCYKKNYGKAALLYRCMDHEEFSGILLNFGDIDKNGKWKVLPCVQMSLKKGGYVSHSYLNQNAKDFEDLFITYGSDLMVFSTLLSCKNITEQTIEPPPKVNKKRIKNGKLPLYSYKILTVNQPGLSTCSERRYGDPLSHNRLHFQRGHFKRYTEDRPLLGKHTGLFWWQPHLRGQNKDGFVAKDYKIAQ